VKDGETAEQAIRRHEKPSLSFFESIATPRYLSMPRNTITFGATELTPAGPRPAEPTPRKKPEKRPPAVRGNRA